MRIVKHPLLAALVAAVWFWAPVMEVRAVPLWTSGSAAGDAEAPPPVYEAYTAVFDGADDYIRSENNGDIGFADGTNFTVAVHIRPDVVNVDKAIVNTATGAAQNRIYLSTTAAGLVRLRLYDSAGTAVVDLTSSVTLTTGVWAHLHFAVDSQTVSPSTASANTKLWINGVEDTALTETTLGGTVDFAHTGDRYTIGGNSSVPPTTASLFDGAMANLWLNDSYVGNNALFYDNGPVDLGPNGTGPTGAQPCFFFSRNGSGNSWTNQGSAGGFATPSGGGLGTTTSP